MRAILGAMLDTEQHEGRTQSIRRRHVIRNIATTVSVENIGYLGTLLPGVVHANTL